MVQAKIKKNQEDKEILNILYETIDIKIGKLQECIKKENVLKKELGIIGD